MKSLLLCLGLVMGTAALCQAQALAPTTDEVATPPVGNTESAASASTPVSVDPNYQLQPDDVIEVVVFREPDLTTSAIVRKDGMFEMKLLGAIKVAGLSVDQATEAIRSGLGKDYLVSPRVSLSIVSYAQRRINVLGEVRTPGLYGYPSHGRLMLSDAVAMAGGFLSTSDTARVLIRRTVDDAPRTLEVNASAGGNSEANSFEVRPDDAVTVSLLPKRHFTVLGQINRPGDYDVGDARPVYLTDAIALAGGFTRLADSSRVMLKRIRGGQESVLRINARAMANSASTERLLIEDEDIITVPETLF